jgi:hypothetical protein
MNQNELPEVVGLQEISDLLDVGRRTPHAWQYRKLLPPPDFASINGLRAWRTSTILQWAANTGRLPARLRGVVVADSSSDLPVIRGGRRAKAENLDALRAAGILAAPVQQSVDTATAANEAAGPGVNARWSAAQ